MKETVTYDTKCCLCEKIETYILRSKNSNPMNDESVRSILARYKDEAHRFLYCEACKKETRQEIVSFDY